MNLVLPIPDELAQRLGAVGDVTRRALEAFGVTEYQAERLTESELRRMLDFETRYELDGFLKERVVFSPTRWRTCGASGRPSTASASDAVGTFIAYSGPLRSLLLICKIEILPKLMGDVLIPPEVKAELDRPQTPAPVRARIAAPPSWIAVRPAPDVTDPALTGLDAASGPRSPSRFQLTPTRC